MTRKCNMTSIEAKIAATRREFFPKSRFKPLFEHLLGLARDSAKHGYCTRAGREIKHAKKVAGY